jgi:hypothetical protein
MRKVHLVLVGLLAMSSTLLAAVPHSPSPVAPAAIVSTAGAATTVPATAPLTLADVFSPATPSASQACNLLCIQGDHCCIIKKQATCIPNAQACP